MRTSPLLIWLALVMAASPAFADGAALDRLVHAYPDFLAGHDATSLKWKDGTTTPVSDGQTNKTFEEKLKRPSILDQMELIYAPGPMAKPPGPEDDPGRFRNVAFFDHMYGDCAKGETQRKLVRVPWLPKSGGASVMITSVNGVADKLRAVSDELDALPADIRRAAFPSAGTFNCRAVKDTGNRSMHAWGAAIDLNTQYADYWLWGHGGYKNRMPMQIVAIFERHGFIWGGKWGHYDTMHFEYRPELLAP